jgi:hypothetical protein
MIMSDSSSAAYAVASVRRHRLPKKWQIAVEDVASALIAAEVAASIGKPETIPFEAKEIEITLGVQSHVRQAQNLYRRFHPPGDRSCRELRCCHYAILSVAANSSYEVGACRTIEEARAYYRKLRSLVDTYLEGRS